MPYSPQNTLSVAIAFALWSSAAHADRFTDTVVKRFKEMGFEYIEVKEGITQVKVEAIRDRHKYEIVYDRDTGRILKQETERARANEIGLSGVEIDTRNRDFLKVSDNVTDDTDDDEDDEFDHDENDDESSEDESDESDESSDENDESDSDESDESDESDDSGSDEGDESDDD